MKEQKKIILASASPRRKALLTQAGLDFDIVPAEEDEAVASGILPEEAVQIIAKRKAQAVSALFPDAVVIGADTVVSIDGHIFGKPIDEEDAFNMLKALSGKTHQVHTGVAICGSSIEEVFACCTEVTFFRLKDDEIKAYIQTGEPMDKAGSYGIQGKGRFLVEKISGNYENVVGLPIGLLLRVLKAV